MCSEVLNELTLFSQELQRSLSPQALQQLARNVGLAQRTSKYQAKDLIALCVWLSQKVASTSLTVVLSLQQNSLLLNNENEKGLPKQPICYKT